MSAVRLARNVRWVGLLALGLLLLAAALFAPRARAESQFDEVRFYQWMSKIDKFDRQYRGCDVTGFPPDLRCSAGRSKYDSKTYRQIGLEALAMFKGME